MELCWSTSLAIPPHPNPLPRGPRGEGVGGCSWRSSLNACAAAFDDVHQLFEVDLAGVAAGGLEECAVGGAEVDAFLGSFVIEEAVGEAAGEAVAAADAVLDLEVLVPAGFVELALGVQDRRPVVDQAALDLAESGADDLDVGIGLHDFFDHSLE